jgi:hypothetical protein
VSLFRPREGQQQEKEKPQKKNAPIGYEKSEDVGHVESNTLAKGQPFVCLFLATVQRLKNDQKSRNLPVSPCNSYKTIIRNFNGWNYDLS